MKTGIDYIEEERASQIEKHGYSVEHAIENPQWYDKNQLLKAGDFCLIGDKGDWPEDWITIARDKILKKDRVGQLACAGAFYKAHDQIFGTDHSTNIELCAQLIDSYLAGSED